SDDFNPTYDDLKALTSVPGEWDKRNVNDGGAVNGSFEIEGLIPADVGEGRWMRIIGIYTADNQLMYVFLYPSWQKPINNGNLLIEVP
ncbi:phage tail protein, partial [Vibrio vulnificus]|uniref:phage tail-collar fiber domain-containing protein n=1 Tax=Vibrio vulnificus TaxID=672 RepID=UPI000D42EA44